MKIIFKNNYFKKMAFMAIFCSLWFSVNAQVNNHPIFTFDQSIHLADSLANQLSRAWSGGFRSPQFSELDINDDGIKDLFVFDRYDNSISVFEYNNGDYIYKPNYDYYFPALSKWVLLRDYNCDGKNDIFAESTGGIQVWENTSTSAGLSFSLTNAYMVGANGPLTVDSWDIPSISDIDDDGDIDILAFGNTNRYVNYYKNLAVENGNGCGLDFETYTQCWGHFNEGGASSTINLNDDCGGNKPAPSTNQNPSPQGTMHQGSTLLAFDNDGDGDKELLVGDISSYNLKLLRNGGNLSDAVVDSVTDYYPLINPADMYIYLAAYLIDTDKDGGKDLIVSPADGSQFAGKNYEQNWLYSNVGSFSIPNFQFTQNDFITDEAIEVGAGAMPLLYDFDFDGDLDMFVSNFAYRESPTNVESKVMLYENIGTVTSPSFQLIDKNFANLKTTNTILFGKYLTFADLDNDGDDDLVIGLSNGKLRYYENSAGANQIGIYTLFVDTMLGEDYMGIDVGYNASPELVDYDRDGDFDLLIGEYGGIINYFENIGTPLVANFNQISDSVGGIDLSTLYGGGYTTPRIADLNQNNNYDLVVGSIDGLIMIYMDIENYSNIENTYSFEDSTYFNGVSQTYTNIQFSQRTAPGLGDLDNDGFPEMLVGLFRGGIHYLKNSSDSIIIPMPKGVKKTVDSKFLIYPNPTNGNFSIEFENDFPDYSISIINSVGQKCNFDYVKNNKIANISLNGCNNGLYFIIIEKDNQIVYKTKIAILN